jgi:hypothetical protein
MSLKFNSTSTPYGLVQLYELEIGANLGDVSGDTQELAKFVARANIAKQNYLYLWATSDGRWEADDQTHSSYPIETGNIVSGQRDYIFDEDGGGNKINDISKVLILPSATATEYIEISHVDELRDGASQILVNTRTGVPYQYGFLSNGIFLDPVPSYSVSNGIKIIVNREGSQFTTSSDSTTKTGLPVYEEYLYLKPAYEEASIKNLANLGSLEKKVIDLEGSERLRVTGKIKEFFSRRNQDERRVMTGKKIQYI